MFMFKCFFPVLLYSDKLFAHIFTMTHTCPQTRINILRVAQNKLLYDLEHDVALSEKKIFGAKLIFFIPSSPPSEYLKLGNVRLYWNKFTQQVRANICK